MAKIIFKKKHAGLRYGNTSQGDVFVRGANAFIRTENDTAVCLASGITEDWNFDDDIDYIVTKVTVI
jgi:hypothetical protein